MHQENSKEFIATGSHGSSTTTAWETRQEKRKKKQQQKTQWWNKHLKYLKKLQFNLQRFKQRMLLSEYLVSVIDPRPPVVSLTATSAFWEWHSDGVAGLGVG